MMKSRSAAGLAMFVLLLTQRVWGFEYQFSVPTGDRESRAFLWIPPDCQHVRALLIANQVILEDQVCGDPIIRAACAKEGIGIVILYRDPAGQVENYHRLDLPRNKVVDQLRDLAAQNNIEIDIKPPSTAPSIRAKKHESSDVVLQNILDQLAEQSGYSEVATAPLLTLGHSGGAIFAWDVAYCWPKRILGLIGLHSAVIFPPSWDPKAIPAGFPALCISGEYESWTGPDIPLDNHWRWLRGGVLDMRGHYDSQACEIVQPGCSHFNWDPPLARHVAMFIQKAAHYRIPDAAEGQPVELKTLPMDSGWLTDIQMLAPSHFPPAPYKDFKDDPALGFWHMDQELAESAENFPKAYGGTTDQRVTFVSDGKPLPASWIEAVPFEPQDDGITIKMTAAFLDKTPEGVAGAGQPLGHADQPIKFRLIGGWAGGGEQTGPDTFRIRFDHFGPTDNIQIMAYAEGNEKYKYAEQPCQIKYPGSITSGKPQTITFAKIDDIDQTVKSIPLSATSSAGSPVRYFIRQGPAVVDGDTLKLEAIPPRAKFPVKVDIVAYQPGRSVEPTVQTAAMVEQTFLIRK
jgi:hypothetical protein